MLLQNRGAMLSSVLGREKAIEVNIGIMRAFIAVRQFLINMEGVNKELSRCKIGTLNKGRGSNIKYLSFAFSELGVAILSNILNTKIAIEVNRGIMRAFVAVRKMISNPQTDKISRIQQDVKELREYMEDVFTDQNDINEDTRMQLKLINQTLAELQVKHKEKEKKNVRGLSL